LLLEQMLLQIMAVLAVLAVAVVVEVLVAQTNLVQMAEQAQS
jgi:hypothetical protein